MTQRFSHPTRELLPCPYCAQPHLEDLAKCPTSGQGILLDGKYRLKKLIGEGSFGLVWDARNIDTQKEVAIKSLRAEVVSNPTVLARFFWEATAAGRIHNPHVCDVLDLVKSSAHGPYIVLERLSGRSLEALIQEQGQLGPEQAVPLLRQALIGLEAVHKAGIIHRDIKPENIFLHEPADDQVVVKLLDFGISKFSVAASSKSRTAADLFMGTPEYCSPEQARGAAQVDLRTDIWAIGAILYKALAGAPPFQAPDVPSLLTAIIHAPHRPLAQVAPQVPAGLVAVVDRCLAKDRERRFASCAELSAALAPFENLQFARTVVDARPARPEANPRERTQLAEAPPDPSRHADVMHSYFRDELPAGAGRPPAAELELPAGELVIVCCNPADRRWLEHLRNHLAAHRDGGRLTMWECAEPAGYEALVPVFARARAVVLLVSQQFLDVDLAPGSALYSQVFMAQGRGIPVTWTAIGASAYEGSDVLDFKALGDPSRPLERLPFTEADRALEQVCEELVATVGVPHTTPVPGSSVQPARPASSGQTDRTELLEQRLITARARKAELAARGEDTRAITTEINTLRRSLRMGRPLQHGDILDDRFVVLDQLGTGGFATVWRALDQQTDQPVALKLLHAQHVHNAERRERFFRGSRIMAQLDHPNIVKIIEPWASDGEYEYFVMQYVAGGTLRDAVLRGRLSTAARVQMLIAVADALAFAHERGIIHRDVKPSNILVSDDGTPYLSDFDLVRAEDTFGGTAGGLGTVIYAAPEMMERASEADARADVYGLGMTLAFLFYERDLTMEVIRNTDRLIGELNVPESIRMVIRTAISWNREHRFRSAGEFRAALSAAVARRDSLPPTVIGSTGTVLAPAATPAATMLAGSAPSRTPPEPATSLPDIDLSSGSGMKIAAVAPPAGASEPNLSLVKAFAQISKESEVLGDNAVSEVFASLEVHEDDVPEPARSAARALTPLPKEDPTLPETMRRAAPRAVALIVVGAGALAALAYLLLAS